MQPQQSRAQTILQLIYYAFNFEHREQKCHANSSNEYYKKRLGFYHLVTSRDVGYHLRQRVLVDFRPSDSGVHHRKGNTP